MDLSRASDVKKTILGLSLTLPMVRSLHARGVPFTVDAIRPLFRRLRAVREIDVSQALLPSGAVSLIMEHCQGLEALSLAYCKSITAEDLGAITYAMNT